MKLMSVHLKLPPTVTLQLKNDPHAMPLHVALSKICNKKNKAFKNISHVCQHLVLHQFFLSASLPKWVKSVTRLGQASLSCHPKLTYSFN